jgi:hypothetical protein
MEPPPVDAILEKRGGINRNDRYGVIGKIFVL